MATWHDGKKQSPSFGTRAKTGSKITLSLDCDAGTLSMHKDGVDFGVMFAGLPGAPLFPAVSLFNENDSLTIVPGVRCAQLCARACVRACVRTYLRVCDCVCRCCS